MHVPGVDRGLKAGALVGCWCALPVRRIDLRVVAFALLRAYGMVPPATGKGVSPKPDRR